ALQQLVATLGLEENVIWTGYIPDKELSVLLSGATIFVYPSLYEGFGIPILEAMQCDVPIITSNISSMPEVAGDAALLVDPTNVEELTAAMQQLLFDENLRTQLVERGRIQHTHFSYRHMAEEILTLYQTA
ncbi:MAG: glycosyltransferase family 4 protein, partial [Chloroflexota bacterium]|nr:glycosyltransferase family 4 protein [Chloroflexota bacterium]